MNIRYDKAQLDGFLKDFYLLTGIRTTIFDDSFNEIAQYPPKSCSFCRMLRQNPDLNEKCKHSDAEAFRQCKQTGKLVTYTCHAGLVETAAPIKYENITIGYMMFGQLRPLKDKDKGWADVEEKCAGHSINMELLHNAYQKLHYYPPEQINATSRVLEACAGYIWMADYITLGSDDLAARLENYIEQNITRKITCDTICRDLRISRALLYETSGHSYGTGIASVIRKKRLNLAKQLLSKTDRKISEVAVMTGIDDYNYFTKLFKSDTGLTPKEYRRKHVAK